LPDVPLSRMCGRAISSESDQSALIANKVHPNG
jgi:hypothetical protein